MGREMNAHLINLGRDMAVVNDCGIAIGFVRPLEEQIAVAINKSFYESHRRFGSYVVKAV